MTKKAKTHAELKEELVAHDAETKPFQEEHNRLRNILTDRWEKREKLVKKLEEAYFQENTEIDWAFLLKTHDEDGREVGKVHYDKRLKICHETFKGAVYLSGYWPETDQSSFVILDNDGKHSKSYRTGLKTFFTTVLPVYKARSHGYKSGHGVSTPVPDEVKMFQKGWSEDGKSYVFISEEKGFYGIVRSSYSYIYSVAKFNSLEALIDHLCIHHVKDCSCSD